jgi:acyl-CoA synthetase (AMP-forming)/AMP-acid ligase II
VLHTQRAAVLQAHRFADFMRLAPDDRIYTTYPFFWTAGIAMSIGGAFAAGARLLVQPTFEPGAALEMIERERATAARLAAPAQRARQHQARRAATDQSREARLALAGCKLAGVGRTSTGQARHGLGGLYHLRGSAARRRAAQACNGVLWPRVSIRIVTR